MKHDLRLLLPILTRRRRPSCALMDGWGERSIYLEQTFESGGAFVARALIDARFLGRGGERIGIGRLAEAVGMDPVSPPLSPAVRAWVDALAVAADNDTASDTNADTGTGTGTGVAKDR